MAGLHWTSYVGMITGIIGALTGIAGAIMGYIAYRRSSRLKALNLRLQLRKDASDFHAAISRVRDLIDKAHKSKRNTNAARGMLKSGQMEAWEKEMEVDKRINGQLSTQFQKSEYDFNAMSEKELESGQVTVHQLQNHIRKIEDKYFESIRFDEKLAKEIREGAPARYLRGQP